MPPINDGELASFDGSNDHRRKLRPVEIFSDLIDIYSAVTSTTNLLVSIHSRNGAGPGENSELGELKYDDACADKNRFSIEPALP